MANLNAIKKDDIVEKIKDLFGIVDTQIVGLDIGLSAVKMAEVSRTSNGYKLTKFVSIPLSEGSLIEDEIQKEEEIISAIQAAHSKMKAKTKQVCIGLFGPNSVVRKIQLPGGTIEEIEDQVLWEAEQYLPFPVEETNLDQFIVGENEGGGVDVVVAAVRKELLSNYKALVENSGFKLKIADIGALALNNVFELAVGDKMKDKATVSWLVIDFGAQKSTCLIYKNGMPLFIKELQIGGNMITEEIQRQLGVNYSEAEDLKIYKDENGNFPEEISNIISDISSKFCSEIKKMVDFYVTSTSDDSLDTCYVTGGNLNLDGFLERMAETLGLEIEIINPFDAIEVDKSIPEDQLEYIAHAGVVAIGLAMRQLKV